MATSYTLHFSDPTNPNTVEVLGTASGVGKNNYSTSLDLVGPGYSNYGLDTAQNFLKILENFASPLSPPNAIKGQLWYDTSDPARSVLRVNNGKLNSSRWPAASGIYQQTTDPAEGYSTSVTVGDIWVDTTSNQMSIRNATGWTIVGPTILQSGSEKSGPEVQILTDNTVNNNPYPVILNWVSGKVVEIISYNEFTPRTVIDGFSTLKPGTNLTSRVAARYNGIAEKATSLYISQTESIKATEVLKNKSLSVPQVHDGEFVVESVNGLKIRHKTNPNSNTIEAIIKSPPNAAYIQYRNTNTDSTLQIGIGNSVTGAEPSYIKFNSNGSIGINKTTTSAAFTLDVNGSAAFSGNVLISDTGVSSLRVNGDAAFSKSVSAAAISVTNVATFSNGLILGTPVGSGTILTPANHDTYDLGSSTNAFRQLYVSEISSPDNYITIYGTVSAATALANTQTFSIQGQFESIDAVDFNGTDDVQIDVIATPSLITGNTLTTATTSTQNLLVYDTEAADELKRISKADFLSDIYAQLFRPGMIISYGNGAAPTETKPSGELQWLICDGSTVDSTEYISLFTTIGNSFGGIYPEFKVPNMTTSTYVSTGTGTGTYLTYIIKT
jgi:hypothetical protein